MTLLVPFIAITVLALFGIYLLVLIASNITRALRTEHLYVQERGLLSAQVKRLTDRLAQIDVKSGALAWAGHRKFVLAGKVLEGDNVCSFYLAPHDGQALPPFLPGQYLTFRLQPAGRDRPVTRCYSLSDSPTHPDYYRVTVKRILQMPGIEGSHDGFVSTLFHQQIAPDDLLDVKAPSGHFYLDPEHQGPVVLVAGGIGITPLLSMLNYIGATGSKRETWLFYGVTHGGEHIMRDYLNEVAAEHENVHLQVCYSEPREGIDVLGTDYHRAGFVSVALFRELLPSNNYDFFVCGPPPMMDRITRELEGWGVPESRIHFEAFGAATVKKVHKEFPAASAANAVEVEFARSGSTLRWDGSAASLLEFAEANDIPMDSGCRAGNCGSCITAIRSGRVDYLNEPGAPVEEGSCLTCISVPRGPLVLDA